MKESDWIDGVRTRLRDAEMTPPVDGWAHLERRLDQPRGALFAWPWLVGAAAAAMIVVVCGVMWWSAPADAVVDESLLVSEQTIDTLLPIVEEPVEQTTCDLAAHAEPPRSLPATPTREEEFSIAFEEVHAERGEQLTDKAAAEELADQAEEQTIPATEADTATSPVLQRSLLVASNERGGVEPIRKKSWRLGVMGSGGRAVSAMGAMQNQSDQLFDTSSGIFGDGDSDTLQIPLVPKQILVTNRQMTHYQPWSLGVTLSRELGRGFSFETGLVYTLLRSEMRYMTYSTMQQMHLLGVPLRIDKEIFGAGRFSLYAGLGGMVEIPVHSSFDGRRVAERAVQCSLTATLGAEYRIGRLTALYAEPGLAWYMTETHLETIRTEHPLTLSLCLGLRFRLGMKE